MEKYKIIWTENALRQYSENLDYLLNEWNRKTMRGFIEKVNDNLERLKVFPNLGQVYKNSHYRRIFVVDQISLFYRYENNSIFIVSLWNNYQKPIQF